MTKILREDLIAERIYNVFLLFRFLLVFSSGYIQPDEQFQSPEIAAKDVLGLDSFIPWEFGGDPITGKPLAFTNFSSNVPCRSITFPMLSAHLPYYVCKHLLGSVFPTPYLVLVVPKIWTFLLSICNDAGVWILSDSIGVPPKPTLAMFAILWPTLVFCSRTFSNTYEMYWLCVLAVIVVRRRRKGRTITTTATTTQLAANEATMQAVTLGVALAFAIFTRFSIVVFAFPLGVFMLVDQTGYFVAPDVVCVWPLSTTTLQRTVGCVVAVFTSTVVVASCIITIDTCYFSSPSYSSHDMCSWSSLDSSFFSTIASMWVITPLNNFRFNSITANLVQFGLHPRWFHAVVNLQLLYGPIPLCLIFELTRSRGRYLWETFDNSDHNHDQLHDDYDIDDHDHNDVDNDHDDGDHVRVDDYDHNDDGEGAIKIKSKNKSKNKRDENKSEDKSGDKGKRNTRARHCTRRVACLRIALLSSSVLGVLALSYAPHQEARFLLPVAIGLLPVVTPLLLRGGSKLWWAILLFNVLVTIFYSTIHQAGVLPSVLWHTTQPPHHLLLYHGTYMPPRTLTQQTSLSRVVDFSHIANLSGFENELEMWLDKQQLCKVEVELANVLPLASSTTTSSSTTTTSSTSTTTISSPSSTTLSSLSPSSTPTSRSSSPSTSPTTTPTTTTTTPTPTTTPPTTTTPPPTTTATTTTVSISLAVAASINTTLIEQRLHRHNFSLAKASICFWPHFSGEHPPSSLQQLQLCIRAIEGPGLWGQRC